MKPVTVLLLFGGKSTEHEVSIRSAQSVFRALDPKKYRVVPVGITKSGAWIHGPAVNHALKTGSDFSGDSSTMLIAPVPQESAEKQIFPSILHDTTPDSLIAFPVLHGLMGEDGTIQGLLELANIAYVGCGVAASAIGMDKIIQKDVLRQHLVPVVDSMWFRASDWDRSPARVTKKIIKYFGGLYPLFVKPSNSGSSVGVVKVSGEKDIAPAIEEALLYDTKVIVETGMENVHEIEVSVLGNDEPIASVCGEIQPADTFYSYEAKYIRDDTTLVVPARLPKKLATKVRETAVKAFQAIDGSGMARVDFFVRDATGELWVNELNTIPGFTSISMYPKLWEATGVSYAELVDRLITLGFERWRRRQALRRSK